MTLRTFSTLTLALCTGALALSGCGLGGGADVGGDTQTTEGNSDAGPQDDHNPPKAGTGGSTANTPGAGGATGSVGGAVGSTGGATGTAGAGNPGGEKCGNSTCGAGQYCCNASCGMCAPIGAACIQIACEDPPPAVDGGKDCSGAAVMCGPDEVWSVEKCACVPKGGQCLPFAPCAKGSTWSMTTCECVPDAQCTSDKDCTLVDDYCGGCNCRALLEGTKVPECTGQIFECFAEPCMNKTAACVNGACVAQ